MDPFIKFPVSSAFPLKFPGKAIFPLKFPGSGAPSAPHILQPWLSPYVFMREENITELRKAMNCAGVMPHSKVRKSWEDPSDFKFEVTNSMLS